MPTRGHPSCLPLHIWPNTLATLSPALSYDPCRARGLWTLLRRSNMFLSTMASRHSTLHLVLLYPLAKEHVAFTFVTRPNSTAHSPSACRHALCLQTCSLSGPNDQPADAPCVPSLSEPCDWCCDARGRRLYPRQVVPLFDLPRAGRSPAELSELLSTDLELKLSARQVSPP